MGDAKAEKRKLLVNQSLIQNKSQAALFSKNNQRLKFVNKFWKKFHPGRPTGL